jgi:hypothetical protein
MARQRRVLADLDDLTPASREKNILLLSKVSEERRNKTNSARRRHKQQQQQKHGDGK